MATRVPCSRALSLRAHCRPAAKHLKTPMLSAASASTTPRPIKRASPSSGITAAGGALTLPCLARAPPSPAGRGVWVGAVRRAFKLSLRRGDAAPEAGIEDGGNRHQHPVAPPLAFGDEADMRRQAGRLEEGGHDIDGTRPAPRLGEGVADRDLIS